MGKLRSKRKTTEPEPIRSSRWVRTIFVLSLIFAARQFSVPLDIGYDDVNYTEAYAEKVMREFRLPSSSSSQAQDVSVTHDQVIQEHQRPKPKLILHIGPPKTGSTTIQCQIDNSFLPELERDNYAYIGRHNVACQNQRDHKDFRIMSRAFVTDFPCHRELNEYARSIVKNNSIPTPSCLNGFLSILNRHRNDGKNVFFSDESVANRLVGSMEYNRNTPFPFAAFKEILKEWDVVVFTLHRPLYDYLPSLYVERYKEGPNKKRMFLWHNQNKDTQGSCIEQGGKVIPMPFDDDPHFETSIGRLIKPNQEVSPTPAMVYELLKNVDWNLRIVLVDLHSQMGFLEEILCHPSLNATHTCQAYRSQTKQEEPKNPSVPLHYDFIAVKGCQIGHINGTAISRAMARHLIKKHQETDLSLKANDLPLVCPNEDVLKHILKLSLEDEKKLREDEWNREHEEQHVRGFWKAAEKKKFCMVNATKVMEDDKWVAFLQNLKE